MEAQELYQVDSVPVSTLPDRYGIGKTAIYDRLKALGISPEKRGRASYVSSSQMEQLDELDIRLKAGELMPSLSIDEPIVPISSIATLSPSTDSILQALEMFKPDPDPLRNHEFLKRCADNRYLLTTRELRRFAGTVPNCVQEFNKMGFTFTRSNQNNAEWIVSRLVPLLKPEDLIF